LRYRLCIVNPCIVCRITPVEIIAYRCPVEDVKQRNCWNTLNIHRYRSSGIRVELRRVHRFGDHTLNDAIEGRIPRVMVAIHSDIIVTNIRQNPWTWCDSVVGLRTQDPGCNNLPARCIVGTCTQCGRWNRDRRYCNSQLAPFSCK